MCHVTRYCNMNGPDHIWCGGIQQFTYNPSLSCGNGLDCKTQVRVGHANMLLGVIIPIDLTKVLCIDLTTGLGLGYVVSQGRLT